MFVTDSVITVVTPDASFDFLSGSEAQLPPEPRLTAQVWEQTLQRPATRAKVFPEVAVVSLRNHITLMHFCGIDSYGKFTPEVRTLVI